MIRFSNTAGNAETVILLWDCRWRSCFWINSSEWVSVFSFSSVCSVIIPLLEMCRVLLRSSHKLFPRSLIIDIKFLFWLLGWEGGFGWLPSVELVIDLRRHLWLLWVLKLEIPLPICFLSSALWIRVRESWLWLIMSSFKVTWINTMLIWERISPFSQTVVAPLH